MNNAFPFRITYGQFHIPSFAVRTSCRYRDLFEIHIFHFAEYGDRHRLETARTHGCAIGSHDGDYFTQTAALAHNDCGTFRDDWCRLKVNPACPCVFTRGMDLIRLPLRHGEGKFVADAPTLAAIEARDLVAVRYADADGNPATEFPENPNGSLNSIAGICDPTGRVFGLMPHPEAFLSPYNAPDWTVARDEKRLPEKGDGVAFFENAVRFFA